MKALIGLTGAAVVLAAGGVDAFSSSMASLAAATAAGCWFVSGWIFD
jgi:hypothetical protein